MTEQDRQELRALLEALKWLAGMLLAAAGFTSPFWIPASWILR